MSHKPYRTAPVPSEKMPKGIKYIVGNEAAERFSYYGMKTILVIFMTKYLMDSNGNYAVMSREEALSWYHLFGTANYAFPILGALLADTLLGKYKTILSISLMYCAGHAVLAFDETRMGLALGLTLIAIGSGGIKPCVSAHVGDQFGKTNSKLIEKVFGWFYFAINLGAFASSIMTPVLLQVFGPTVAFGVPGLLMLIATIVFWMGRHEFVHIPPGGMAFIKETLSPEGIKVILKLCVIYAFVAMFWALFDQTGSAWVLQAQNMDRNFLGIEWLPSQIQAINPILIMTFIPIFNFWLYPAINKLFKLTAIRKIALGFFVAVPSFLVPAWIESRLGAGEVVNIGWQLLAYVIITASEVLVSITCLEFSYTQAPKRMKSLIMGFFLLSVSFGNLFTAAVNIVIQDEVEVASGLEATGELQVEVPRRTDFALVCEAGSGEAAPAAEATTEVSIARPGASDDEDETDEESTEPEIVSYQVNGSDRVVVAPGESATLTWESANTEKCFIRPPGAEVELSGSLDVSPDETTTFVLACAGEDPNDEIEESVTVVVTDGVGIVSFATNLDEVTSAGESVMLSWNSVRGESCSVLARTVKLEGGTYYVFFAGAMLITALLFLIVVRFYKEKTYIQDEAPAE